MGRKPDRPHGPLPAPRRDGLPLSGRPPGRAVPGRPDRPRRGRAAPESRVRRRPMTLVVVLLALAAAGLHAGWNVLLKSSGDPLPTSTRSLAASAAVVPALITGLFIGIYTTLDRVGINLGSPWLYGGLLWLLIALLLAAWTRGRPLGRGAGENWRTSIAIGLMSALAYGLVLVALVLAPVAIVAPLRESAIVLVTAWGVWKLKEREGAALRLAGAVAIVIGIALIALA